MDIVGIKDKEVNDNYYLLICYLENLKFLG